VRRPKSREENDHESQRLGADLSADGVIAISKPVRAASFDATHKKDRSKAVSLWARYRSKAREFGPPVHRRNQLFACPAVRAKWTVTGMVFAGFSRS
jgi:hypothetical protein